MAAVGTTVVRHLRPRLAVLSRLGRDSLAPLHWQALERCAHVHAVRCERAPGPDEAAALLRDADVLGATNACLPEVDEALLDRLPRLRAVVLYATGYDRLDVPLLERRGVGLSVVNGYATGAVAEHALAMLLAMATRLPLAHDRSRGLAPPAVSLRGVELAGRTLGVVGLGRIGRRLSALAAGLGMRVAGCDPDPAARELAAGQGVELCAIEALLPRADAVAVCASHTHGAPPVLGADEVAALPRHAFLVNVGRPALVDTTAVVAAVRAGRLRGYAVDEVVLDPAADGDLLAQGRVLQTGHSAWWRDEVLARGAVLWAERLLGAVTGHPLDVVTWPAGGVAGPASPAAGGAW